MPPPHHLAPLPAPPRPASTIATTEKLCSGTGCCQELPHHARLLTSGNLWGGEGGCGGGFSRNDPITLKQCLAKVKGVSQTCTAYKRYVFM
jgi:hypothetical protein